MKKLLFISVLLSLLIASATAQVKIKVLEKSAKKVPTWVSSSQADYIITSAIAGDLETAKNQCLEDVRKQIIRAVAENVKSSTEGSIDQQIMNNKIVGFLDSFSSSYQTQSASVPFLKGISAAKIEDYYWEKRQNKGAKEVSYHYSIKYPFPSIELKKMMNEFEKRDREIYQKYLELEKGLNSVSSLEEIDQAILSLSPIITYFFDDARKNAALLLQQKYRNLYGSISFRGISNKLGEYRFSLILDGRVVATSQRITAKSDGATYINAESHGEEIIVKYSYDGAEYDTPNDVVVNLKIGGKTVPHRFSFTVAKTVVQLWPDKTVYLTAEGKSDTLLTNITIRMQIKSDYNSPYIINSLTLEVPGLSEPIFFDFLDQTFNKKESTLNVIYTGSIGLVRGQNNKLNMLRGNMGVNIQDEGVDTRIDFSLPFRANW